MQNQNILKFIEKILIRSENQVAIKRALAEAREKLSTDPDCPVSTKPLDVSIFGNDSAESMAVHLAVTDSERSQNYETVGRIFP